MAVVAAIAVLPFVNMSGDRENEYFSDGVTEELLDHLAKLAGLKVAARTSSFAFKGRDEPVPEIARQLGVEVVLEGSVRKVGDRVRITGQLIDGETGFHLWSETYDRELTNVFAIQDEIASAIATQLELTLDGEDDATSAARPTVNIDAHDLYLLARHRFHRRGAAALAEAERLFRDAIEADPDYAQAYAGLAMTHAVLPLFDAVAWPVARSVAEGKAAAEKGLALDPTLGDAHAALGQIAQNFEWDWAAAERHYRHAV
ncbi:MAG: adenylate/guanylate cyclase domain-containing protein, partial [Longimicrobiales bacterium]